jgi:hypothetical protein
MDRSYLSFLDVASQKIMSRFYMLGFGMEHWVLCNAYGTGAITTTMIGVVRDASNWSLYGPFGRNTD